MQPNAELTGIEAVFPANVSHLMPKYEDIPDEFKRSTNKWVKIQCDWFFRGLKKAKWFPKDGIDQNAAIRHLQAIQGSFEPKHEHKQAAVAFLLSEWFDDVTYSTSK